MKSREFKTEQFYMPSKFVPPFRVGDMYCFPDGLVWEISGVTIATMGVGKEEAKITVHWARPLDPHDPHSDEYGKWFGHYKAGDTNWVGDARAVEIWE